MRAVGTRRVGAVVVGIVLAMVGQGASAIPVSLNTQVLNGGRLTAWNADGDDAACVLSGYTPVNDGSRGPDGSAKSDAFDGGLIVGVNGVGYQDGDGIGEKKGEQLQTGPTSMSGLRVSRLDRALPGSPTLRSLIVLRNNGSSAKNVQVTLDSEVGSDNDTGVRGTSSGDATLTKRDRWVVSSDDDTTPDDPPVVHVLFGKGKARSKVTDVVQDLEGNGCLEVHLSVRVPKKSARYLLFFAEMGLTNEGALKQAAKYNRKGLSAALLKGIPAKVRPRILNWVLA